MRARAPFAQAAFTLLELLVALAVLGLAATVVAPRLAAGLPAVSARGAAAEIAGALQRARSQALTENRIVAVTVEARPPAVRVGDERRGLGAAVDLALAEGRELPVTLRFFPDGSAEELSLQVARAGRSFHITVDWLTGRVQVSAGGAGDARGS